MSVRSMPQGPCRSWTVFEQPEARLWTQLTSCSASAFASGRLPPMTRSTCQPAQAAIVFGSWRTRSLLRKSVERVPRAPRTRVQAQAGLTHQAIMHGATEIQILHRGAMAAMARVPAVPAVPAPAVRRRRGQHARGTSTAGATRAACAARMPDSARTRRSQLKRRMSLGMVLGAMHQAHPMRALRALRSAAPTNAAQRARGTSIAGVTRDACAAPAPVSARMRRSLTTRATRRQPSPESVFRASMGQSANTMPTVTACLGVSGAQSLDIAHRTSERTSPGHSLSISLF